MSFVLFFVAILEITTVYLLQKSGRGKAAVRVHFAGRRAYPGAYFVGMLTLAIAFMG